MAGSPAWLCGHIGLLASLGMSTAGLTRSVLGLLAGGLRSSWVPVHGRTRLVCAYTAGWGLKAACCGAAGSAMAAATVIHEPFLVSVSTEQALSSTGSLLSM